LHGSTELVPEAGGFRLRMQPTTVAYDVRLGDPVVYASRTDPRAHDSRRLPVSGIGPVDAEAFTAWLDRSGRVPGARLCSEVEWERLARGADGRDYPSGDRLPPTSANIGAEASRLEAYGPDQVGSHPHSRSPFGADDLAGNVWELTRAVFGGTEYVARGGSYPLDQGAALSVFREAIDGRTRDITLGFRVCASP
jgi:eukaryotic-like serine/threonine-protein kinase